MLSTIFPPKIQKERTSHLQVGLEVMLLLTMTTMTSSVQSNLPRVINSINLRRVTLLMETALFPDFFGNFYMMSRRGEIEPTWEN